MKICRYLSMLVLFIIITGIISIPKTEAQTVMKLNVTQPAELVAHAGADATIDVGYTALLGASPAATGGTGELTYQWSFSEYLNEGTLANPLAEPPGNLTFTVTVTDERGCTATDGVFITVIGGTLVDDIEAGTLLKIFPNPTSGSFTINLEQVRSTELFISLLNISGTTVHKELIQTSGSSLNANIDISNLPKGCYFLHIKGDHETLIRQIILN